MQPESYTFEEVINERNTETRRAIIGRIGNERFLELSNAPEVASDIDESGNPRKLYRLERRGDTDMVFMTYHCPSTLRKYVKRLPPHLTNPRDGLLWSRGLLGVAHETVMEA